MTKSVAARRPSRIAAGSRTPLQTRAGSLLGGLFAPGGSEPVEPPVITPERRQELQQQQQPGTGVAPQPDSLKRAASAHLVQRKRGRPRKNARNATATASPAAGDAPSALSPAPAPAISSVAAAAVAALEAAVGSPLLADDDGDGLGLLADLLLPGDAGLAALLQQQQQQQSSQPNLDGHIQPQPKNGDPPPQAAHAGSTGSTATALPAAGPATAPGTPRPDDALGGILGGHVTAPGGFDTSAAAAAAVCADLGLDTGSGGNNQDGGDSFVSVEQMLASMWQADGQLQQLQGPLPHASAPLEHLMPADGALPAAAAGEPLQADFSFQALLMADDAPSDACGTPLGGGGDAVMMAADMSWQQPPGWPPVDWHPHPHLQQQQQQQQQQQLQQQHLQQQQQQQLQQQPLMLPPQQQWALGAGQTPLLPLGSNAAMFIQHQQRVALLQQQHLEHMQAAIRAEEKARRKARKLWKRLQRQQQQQQLQAAAAAADAAQPDAAPLPGSDGSNTHQMLAAVPAVMAPVAAPAPQASGLQGLLAGVPLTRTELLERSGTDGLQGSGSVLEGAVLPGMCVPPAAGQAGSGGIIAAPAAAAAPPQRQMSAAEAVLQAAAAGQQQHLGFRLVRTASGASARVVRHPVTGQELLLGPAVRGGW